MTLSEFEFKITAFGVTLIGASFEGQGSTRCLVTCALPGLGRVRVYAPSLEEAAKSLLTRLGEVCGNKPMAQA